MPDLPRIETVVQGQYRISADPQVVLSTVLGSCVAACFFDAEAGIGGMNHYLLPDGGPHGDPDLKYGAMAMELLINELLKRGAARSRLRVKLFGGAQIVANLGSIGERNAAFGRSYVAREGFPILSESLGGSHARRLQFSPATGAARFMIVSDCEARRVNEVAAPVKPKSAITLF
jgi:chemotaxis protein CheD